MVLRHFLKTFDTVPCKIWPSDHAKEEDWAEKEGREAAGAPEEDQEWRAQSGGTPL